MNEAPTAREGRPASARAIVVALVAGWFLVIAPKRSEAAKLQTQIDDDAIADRRRPRDRQVTGTAAADPRRRPVQALAGDAQHAPTSRASAPAQPASRRRRASRSSRSRRTIRSSSARTSRSAIDLVFEGRFYDLVRLPLPAPEPRRRPRRRAGCDRPPVHGRLDRVRPGEPPVPAGEGDADRLRLRLRRRHGDPVPAGAPPPTRRPRPRLRPKSSQPIPAAPAGATAAGA